MILSLAASAPTIICVLWPAGANGAGFVFVTSLRASCASSSFRRNQPMVRRMARTSFSEFCQTLFLGQFDVDAETVGISAGLRDQGVVGLGNGLEMNVATEVMLQAQLARDA